MTTVDIWLKGDALWLKTTREARVYNTQGLVAVDSSATWDTTNSKYDYTVLETYAYDASGNDTCNIHLTYSKSLDDFLNSLRETYAYDAMGNQTVYVKYFGWTKNASATGIWLQVSRVTHTYNANSQIVTTLNEAYDSAGSQWNKGLYEEWAYDGNNNALSETFSNWDTTVNPDAFVPYRKLTWNYTQLTVGTISPVAAVIAGPKASILVSTKNVIVRGREGMTVSVFGINGRQVASFSSAKGATMVAWNFTDGQGNHLAKGSYALKVTAPGMNAVFPLSVCR